VTVGLSIFVVALLGVAIAVQVYYVRGLRKAGVEVTTATKVVVYVNVTLLSIVALGVLVLGISQQLNAAGGR
jgi:hypothetical protein